MVAQQANCDSLCCENFIYLPQYRLRHLKYFETWNYYYGIYNSVGLTFMYVNEAQQTGVFKTDWLTLWIITA